MVIKGFDVLARKMEELAKAAAALDGKITDVSFDPEDPQSIELAIQEMETAINERVGGYTNNEIVQKLVLEVKEQYRQKILQRAAELRSQGDTQS